MTPTGSGTLAFGWTLNMSGLATVTYFASPLVTTGGVETDLGTATGGSASGLSVVGGQPITFTFETHYGSKFAYVATTANFHISQFVVTDYTPGGAAVPEPGALSLLALGAAGVAGRRRRRS